ncbi:MAG: peptidoglycan-binding protein [Oscillospiraceae bacterium]|nr:peptidoglycan-binding protein [Oscillospiraceae bacterium]
MPVVTPYIPRYITVHLGPANQPAENVAVTFPDYIKNVASSEVYPTWNESALRANILAQISFALNRVYTEYYRSRGYDFDITSSTATDQKFIRGRSTFENIDALVDELFDSYIRRKGTVEPLSARFCNGTTVTCEGLSQWGSEDLARQGYNSIDILRHYYGDDIEIVTNAPIQDIQSSYPGYPLRLGSSGDYVTILQVMLNRIGQDYPAIPRITPVDGIFGPQTENAVRKFQSIFGLTPDGVVGKGTWYKLVFLYVGVTDLSELISEGQRFYQVKPTANSTVLQEGSRGIEVSGLQYFISIISQVNNEFPRLQIDGIFGPATRQAVIAAQRYFGLEPTGRVDQATWRALYQDYLAAAEALEQEQGIRLPTAAESIRQNLLSGQFPGYDLRYGGSDERSEA